MNFRFATLSILGLIAVAGAVPSCLQRTVSDAKPTGAPDPKAAERAQASPFGALSSDFSLPNGYDRFDSTNIVNMQLDGGARGDGVTDDTRAFKAVFESGKARPHSRFGAARDIYVPAGTYVLSDSIVWGDKKKFVRGAGRGRTVLLLREGAPGFGNPKRTKTWLDTRGDQHFAQNFEQYIVGITLVVGPNNAGAVALEYHTNNMGGLFNLAILSEDPAHRGAVGLSMTREPGPGLVWDLLVDGFDVGILSTSNKHSMTLGDITLKNQRVAGIVNQKQNLFISHLTSHNRVPALIAGRGGNGTQAGGGNSSGGLVTLTRAELLSPGSQSSAVIADSGILVMRDVEVRGYRKSVQTSEGSKDGSLERFVYPHAGQYSFTSPSTQVAGIPNLPAELPPVPAYEPAAQWVIVDSGKGFTERLQHAIDSGAKTVFLPRGGELQDTIIVRGNVERILGGAGDVEAKGFSAKDETIVHPFFRSHYSNGELPLNKPAFRVVAGTSKVVMFEFVPVRGTGWGIDPASDRTVIVWGGTAPIITEESTQPGKLFLLDVGAVPAIFHHKQTWLWQINTESYDWSPHIANFGGRLWISGHKTEKDRTNLATFAGGSTELNGGFYFKNRERVGEAPAVVVSDSTFSGTWGVFGLRYEVQALITRGQRSQELRTTRTGACVGLLEASSR